MNRYKYVAMYYYVLAWVALIIYAWYGFKTTSLVLFSVVSCFVSMMYTVNYLKYKHNNKETPKGLN